MNSTVISSIVAAIASLGVAVIGAWVSIALSKTNSRIDKLEASEARCRRLLARALNVGLQELDEDYNT